MRRINRGFTIIELLVVVAVIGILATITLIGFNRYQADARDSQRTAQVTIITEALERYYDKNGEYPSCPAITASASTVTASTLPGLETKTLLAPQDQTGATNSIKCQDLLTSDPDLFAYVGDGSTVCSTGNACLEYTLKYKEESTGTIKTVTSRRATSILTSNPITDLVATTYSFSRIDLAWTGIGGASSYNIQWKQGSSDFTTPTGTSTSTIASKAITGLTLGTLYYFRVQPATATAVGNWSNTTSATTFTLDTPEPTAIPDPGLPASQIQVTWSSVANATSYSMQYSSSSAVNGATGDFTTSPTTLTTTSPFTLGSLTAGATRYFHVKAVAAGNTSGWSATTSATTQVPVPTGVVATTNSSTQITLNWDSVSVADTYTVEYATNSGFTGLSTVTGITGISRAFTSLNQGQIYYFRVYALVGAVSSTQSSPANATTTVNTPSTPGLSAANPGAVKHSSTSYWFPATEFDSGVGNYYYSEVHATSSNCASGTSPRWAFTAGYNVKPSGSAQYYSVSGTSASQWFMIQAYGSYYINYTGKYYCQGPDAASSYSGTNSTRD